MSLIKDDTRKRARVSQGHLVLDAITNGVSLTEIAKSKNLSIKRVERLLRDEQQKRWTAATQDYARLQIARVETIAEFLTEKAKNGGLPTFDRLQKALDRLDRYHGFTKLAPLPKAPREDVRARLIAKLKQASRARRAPNE